MDCNLMNIGHATLKGKRGYLGISEDDNNYNLYLTFFYNMKSKELLASGGSIKELKQKIEENESLDDIDLFFNDPTAYCAGQHPRSGLDCRKSITCKRNIRFRERLNFKCVDKVHTLLHNSLSRKCAYYMESE